MKIHATFHTKRNTNWNMIFYFSFVRWSKIRSLIYTVWKRMWQFLLEWMTSSTSSRHIFYKHIYSYALQSMYNENVVSLFIVAKGCKHPECSLIENWLNKLWNLFLKMEYSATVRMRYICVSSHGIISL